MLDELVENFSQLQLSVKENTYFYEYATSKIVCIFPNTRNLIYEHSILHKAILDNIFQQEYNKKKNKSALNYMYSLPKKLISFVLRATDPQSSVVHGQSLKLLQDRVTGIWVCYLNEINAGGPISDIPSDDRRAQLKQLISKLVVLHNVIKIFNKDIGVALSVE